MKAKQTKKENNKTANGSGSHFIDSRMSHPLTNTPFTGVFQMSEENNTVPIRGVVSSASPNDTEKRK